MGEGVAVPAPEPGVGDENYEDGAYPVEEGYYEEPPVETEPEPDPAEMPDPECVDCPWAESGVNFGTDFDQYDCCTDCECREPCEEFNKPKPKPKPKAPAKKPAAKKPPAPAKKTPPATTKKMPPKKAPFATKKAPPSKVSPGKKSPVLGKKMPPKKGPVLTKTPPKKAGPKKPAATVVEGECPYGFTFAVDCNKNNECDHCELWEACQDALDNL
jgi:hypothetical protein